MNKQALIQKVVEKLTADLALYFKAATIARAEATHEQSKAENKYDTRGLEASYLARGQSKQAAEIEVSIHQIAAMEPKTLSSELPSISVPMSKSKLEAKHPVTLSPHEPAVPKSWLMP